nr:hypothetical protein [Tanacetum cinerariifolium]
MCYGDQVANVRNKLKKDFVPRKTRSLTIAKETVVGKLANSISIQESRTQQRRRSQLPIDSQTNNDVANMNNEWGRKLKGPAVYDPTVHSLSDLRKGSIASKLKSLSLDKSEENTNATDDADKSNMYLSNDNPHGYDDATRYEVFMHNKSTTTPNSTYLSLMVTSSSLYFIQTLLDEAPTNELMDFLSHLVYTDAQTTSVVHNLEGNPELTSYISCASEVPLAKKLKAIIQKDELTIAYLEGARLESLKQHYQNDVELEYHGFTAALAVHITGVEN